MLTIDDLTKLYIPDAFGTNYEDEFTDAMEDVVAQLHIEYDFMNYGATKFIVYLNDKEVAKIPFNGEFYWDNDNDCEGFDPFRYVSNYCAFEADIYEEAEELGIEKIFCRTRLAGYTKNHTPFYLSERVFDFYDDTETTPTDKSKEELRKMRENGTPLSCRISADWLETAIDFYGAEFVEKVLRFLNNKHIDDFHSGNIAYRQNGEPVFVDYSGYFET